MRYQTHLHSTTFLQQANILSAGLFTAEGIAGNPWETAETCSHSTEERREIRPLLEARLAASKTIAEMMPYGKRSSAPHVGPSRISSKAYCATNFGN